MLLSLEIIKIIYWTKRWNFSGIQKGIVVPINFSQFSCSLYNNMVLEVHKLWPLLLSHLMILK